MFDSDLNQMNHSILPYICSLYYSYPTFAPLLDLFFTKMNTEISIWSNDQYHAWKIRKVIVNNSVTGLIG